MLYHKSISQFSLLLIFCISIICSFSSCAEEEPVIQEQEATIAGKWKGSISQEGYEDFALNVTIADPSNDDLLDKVIATGNYDNECNFNWIFKGMSEGKYKISENIISGFDACIDGTVELSVLSSNELKYHWIGEDQIDNIATGKLIRQ